MANNVQSRIVPAYWSPDIIRTKNIYPASLHIKDPRENLNQGGNMM
jgi:hypothetical protein